ncbi:hypothetical protein NM688_g1340 [Phlebia brevispora]|uniref:Uncharacterized protein n=1 Tax=Phlebia brevispora TaxID=194682 RepID=A0ACC1TC01_9APHY|nr:hypothetical protein NM688_g1340 [Phlebia brevispora]
MVFSSYNTASAAALRNPAEALLFLVLNHLYLYSPVLYIPLMGQHSSSLLRRIPSEVLEDIAVLAVDGVGPPKELLTLLSICKHVTYNLSSCDLGARVFRSKFDVSAPERRYMERAMYPSTLSAQLRSYCATLQVVRARDIFNPRIEDHLWNVFFMLMENDGMNAAQLVHYAHIRQFIDQFVRTRLHEGKDVENNWPLDNAVNSLALWILWLTTDDDEVAKESITRRQEMMDLVRPYVVNMVRYPVFHIPDNHFFVPIDRMYMGQFPFTVATAHGPYPPYRDAETVVVRRNHFSIDFAMMPPLIGLAARLLYFARSEATPVVPTEGTADDRTHALALGRDWVHPTRADLTEFNGLGSAKAPHLGLRNPQSPLDPSTFDLLSLNFESCFQRLLDCIDPFWANLTAPFELGSLTGDFGGRMLIPDTLQATEMLNAPVYHEGMDMHQSAGSHPGGRAELLPLG